MVLVAGEELGGGSKARKASNPEQSQESGVEKEVRRTGRKIASSTPQLRYLVLVSGFIHLRKGQAT